MLRNSKQAFQDEKHRLWNSFASLQRAPRELWFVLMLKFLESFAYFSISQVLTIFLTKEFHFDDKQAGLIYGVYGALISVYGILFGRRVDELGPKLSLQLGFLLSFISRLSLTLTTSTSILYLNLFLILPVAGALGIPVMLVVVRKVTDDQNRGFAFGLFYCCMNIGALLSGGSIDFLTIVLKEATLFGFVLTDNRLILAFCTLASALGLFVSAKFIKDPRLGGSCGNSNAHKGSSNNNVKSNVKRDDNSLLSLLKDKTFVRFFLFSILMVNLRGIFRHLDATLPKYLTRIHGENVPKGIIYAINPALIIIIVPFITAWSAHIDAFDMILIGSYVSATSAIFLVFSDSLMAAILFVIQLSLGEALWSPRFLDYQVMVAPPGKEASFIALASAPLFLSKLPVGYMSGFLLQEFCPPTPHCVPNETTCQEWIKTGLATCSSDFCTNCLNPKFAGSCDQTCGFCQVGVTCMDRLLECPEVVARRAHLMWLIVLLTTLLSPILIHVFRNHIREPTLNHRYKEMKRNDSSDMSDIFEHTDVIEMTGS